MTITHSEGSEGTDTLIDVESVQFSDKTVSIDPETGSIEIVNEHPVLSGDGELTVESDGTGAIVKSCVWADHAAARSWRSPSTNLTPRMISARWFDPSSFLHFL